MPRVFVSIKENDQERTRVIGFTPEHGFKALLDKVKARFERPDLELLYVRPQDKATTWYRVQSGQSLQEAIKDGDEVRATPRAEDVWPSDGAGSAKLQQEWREAVKKDTIAAAKARTTTSNRRGRSEVEDAPPPESPRKKPAVGQPSASQKKKDQSKETASAKGKAKAKAKAKAATTKSTNAKAAAKKASKQGGQAVSSSSSSSGDPDSSSSSSSDEDDDEDGNEVKSSKSDSSSDSSKTDDDKASTASARPEKQQKTPATVSVRGRTRQPSRNPSSTGSSPIHAARRQQRIAERERQAEAELRRQKVKEESVTRPDAQRRPSGRVKEESVAPTRSHRSPKKSEHRSSRTRNSRPGSRRTTSGTKRSSGRYSSRREKSESSYSRDSRSNSGRKRSKQSKGSKPSRRGREMSRSRSRKERKDRRDKSPRSPRKPTKSTPVTASTRPPAKPVENKGKYLRGLEELQTYKRRLGLGVATLPQPIPFPNPNAPYNQPGYVAPPPGPPIQPLALVDSVLAPPGAAFSDISRRVPTDAASASASVIGELTDGKEVEFGVPGAWGAFWLKMPDDPEPVFTILAGDDMPYQVGKDYSNYYAERIDKRDNHPSEHELTGPGGWQMTEVQYGEWKGRGIHARKLARWRAATLAVSLVISFKTLGIPKHKAPEKEYETLRRHALETRGAPCYDSIPQVALDYVQQHPLSKTGKSITAASSYGGAKSVVSGLTESKRKDLEIQNWQREQQKLRQQQQQQQAEQQQQQQQQQDQQRPTSAQRRDEPGSMPPPPPKYKSKSSSFNNQGHNESGNSSSRNDDVNNGSSGSRYYRNNGYSNDQNYHSQGASSSRAYPHEGPSSSSAGQEDRWGEGRGGGRRGSGRERGREDRARAGARGWQTDRHYEDHSAGRGGQRQGSSSCWGWENDKGSDHGSQRSKRSVELVPCRARELAVEGVKRQAESERCQEVSKEDKVKLKKLVEHLIPQWQEASEKYPEPGVKTTWPELDATAFQEMMGIWIWERFLTEQMNYDSGSSSPQRQIYRVLSEGEVRRKKRKTPDSRTCYIPTILYALYYQIVTGHVLPQPWNCQSAIGCYLTDDEAAKRATPQRFFQDGRWDRVVLEVLAPEPREISAEKFESEPAKLTILSVIFKLNRPPDRGEHAFDDWDKHLEAILVPRRGFDVEQPGPDMECVCLFES